MSGISGNKTQANWDTTLSTDDYWIVKIDINGNYLWDRRFGGTSEDYMESMCATRDGGCLLGGASVSGISGDKTQPSQGGYDMWIVKVDANGNKQWDRRYGGNQDEDLYSVAQTIDGGYILAGRSNSGISGDKTQPNWDTTLSTADYWIVKIDSSGNKQWDKKFGTVWDEACADIIQTPDGGYLLGGTTPGCDTTGDKTQLSFCNSPYNDNFWIVKIDTIGNKQWDKVYGGVSGEIFGNSLNTPDGNYMLGGTSTEGISGNKTITDCGYWLIKIDTLGNIIGQWAYGSGGPAVCAETFGSMTNTPDYGYILTGIGGTDTGGDKTSSSMVNGLSVWTIKVDSLMNRVWDRTALDNGGDQQSSGAFQCSTGCYIVSLPSAAGIGGDKTQSAWDSSYDYWVVEYCDSFPLGIQNPEGTMHLQVYPNPTSGDLYINIQRDNLTEASFTLTNTTGQTIFQNTSDHLAHAYTKILDLSKLPTGVYMLDVVVDGERIVNKVVKK